MQTHKEIEVIAVDDGSTDNSPMILDEYATKEPRLRVIHQSNGGVSSARNAGLAVATGDYIGFCDGDDEVEPTMYERLLANLLKYDADISHCGMLTKGVDGKTRYLYNTGALEVHSRKEGILEILKGERVEPSLCMKLYKKELFQGFQFDPSIRINEDLLANVQLFQKAQRTIYEDVPLYHYMRRDSSASKSPIAEKHVFHPIKARERILELCKTEEETIQRQAIVSYLHTLISTYSLLCTNKASNYHKYKDTFRGKLIEHKDWLRLLPASSQVHALIIVHLPFLYMPILSIYRLLTRSKSYG